MSLEQAYYISQTIASIAVIGSLVYLGLQVRQTDRSQRAAMQQGRADRTSMAALQLASPQLASILRRGLAADPSLTPDEFAQWMMICRSLYLSGEDTYLQFKSGNLDRAAFESYAAGARYYLRSPGLRAMWTISADQFGEDYRRYVDSNALQATGAGGTDTYSDAYERWATLTRRVTPAEGR